MDEHDLAAKTCVRRNELVMKLISWYSVTNGERGPVTGVASVSVLQETQDIKSC